MNIANHHKKGSSFNSSDFQIEEDMSKSSRMWNKIGDQNQISNFPTGEPDLIFEGHLGPLVKSITSKLRSLNAVSKAKSPAFIGQVDKIKVLVTVDEGAELNCIDSMVAKKANVRISRTS